MKTKATLGLFFTAASFFLLLIPSEQIASAVANSVIFCGKTVIPQLFLYICLTSLIWEFGVVETIISAFPKFGAEFASFFIGILGGFPSGAIISGKLLKSGVITPKRGEYLSSFSNNAGISFVFGYISLIVGKTGALSIFICQIASSAFWALFWRSSLSKEDKKEIFPLPAKSPSFSSVVNGIKASVESMINICGFILFFSAFSMGVLSFMPTAIKGLFELTNGISLTKGLPFESRLIYCAFFTGFGGACVHFQVASVSESKMRKYFITKCISAPAFALAVIPIHKLVSSL